jgi:hypothetical protein
MNLFEERIASGLLRESFSATTNFYNTSEKNFPKKFFFFGGVGGTRA